jgi:sialate O-acetylesterase
MLRTLLAGAVAALLLLPSPAAAALSLHPLCTDGMVLQQKTKAYLLGTADANAAVTVTFRGKTYTGKADQNGTFKVAMENLEAGGPFELKVAAENSDPITLKNVYVGEVWIASGQSNMEWSLGNSFEAKADIEKSANPKIRLFTVQKNRAQTPQTTVKGQWVECGPSTVGGFSAVAYYFGRDLQAALKVPVGLIHTSWGGTAAEEWTSMDVLKANPDHLGKHPNQCTLYNAMIAPLIPFAIKGAIWYQGESNASRPELYKTLMPLMIKNWRDDWKQGDFPFFTVQLAPFDQGYVPGKILDHSWAHLREAQLDTSLNVKNSGMAVITDVGEAKDIHPRKKEPVGARLALCARAIAYGEPIVFSGPLYDKMQVRDGKAVLSFKHVGGGLEAKVGELKGFTMAGADNVFKPAKAEIKGDTIVVSSDEVKEPVSVRYGWAGYMEVNLFNKDGLPASPFRTDKLKRFEAKP